MARVLSRVELYELVWSKPMTHLAKDFAVSDAALHKICKKHGIPKPPPGWWIKQTAGGAARPPALPPATAGSSDRITIVGGQREPVFAAAARERARRLVAEDGEAATASHPIVDRTLAKLRGARISAWGTVATSAQGLIKAQVAPENIERLGLLLNRIMAAAAVQGFLLVATGASARFSDGTDTIGFSISEVMERDKHIPTEAEQAKHATWLRRRERAMKVHSWQTLEYDRPKIPEWDERLSGRLSIELEHVFVWGANSPRRTYRDGKVQRLENMVSDIAVAISVLAAAKAEERLRRAREQERHEEQRRLRELGARAKHIEDRRTAALAIILSDLQEIDQLRARLALLASEMSGDVTPRMATFFAWSREQLAAREDRLSPAALEQRFIDDRLFGDSDDFSFHYRGY